MSKVLKKLFEKISAPKQNVGLVARSVANQAHTKILLVNRYAPFPSVTNPSDCAFGFVDTAGLPAKQAMTNAVGALATYVNSANGNWLDRSMGCQTSDGYFL
ncbi:unnamed protein product [Rhizophagus irregularis]|nr:unnamed protein product [Rhizophagus irregularis]